MLDMEPADLNAVGILGIQTDYPATITPTLWYLNKGNQIAFCLYSTYGSELTCTVFFHVPLLPEIHADITQIIGIALNLTNRNEKLILHLMVIRICTVICTLIVNSRQGLMYQSYCSTLSITHLISIVRNIFNCPRMLKIGLLLWP